MDGCTEIQCFEGVECMDIPAPGVGAECGPCPQGFIKDGEKCQGNSSVSFLYLNRLSEDSLS